MSTSYWIISFIPIAISLILLSMLFLPRTRLYKRKGFIKELTPKESYLGRLAIILFVSGAGLTLFGIVVELLLEN